MLNHTDTLRELLARPGVPRDALYEYLADEGVDDVIGAAVDKDALAARVLQFWGSAADEGENTIAVAGGSAGESSSSSSSSSDEDDDGDDESTRSSVSAVGAA